MHYDSLLSATFSFYLQLNQANRIGKYPSKYNIYWDASIPMEYYEDDFIEFEDYLIVTGQRKQSTADDLYANSDLYLDLFKAYEKDRKRRESKGMEKDYEIEGPENKVQLD